MERGKFIVFEGTDGSGKSTQMKFAAKALQARGIPVYTTHEPTDSPFGALLRACMSGRIDADERAIALLFAADRMDHVQNPVNGILKKLREGITVFSDRYYLSSLAYNGGLVSRDWVMELNRPVKELLTPDLTIYLDLSPEEGMRRVMRRGETERYETAARQEKIRKEYFELFQISDEKIRIIESEQDKEATQKKVLAAVLSLFEEGV